jgi:hypothetical protein
MGTWAAGEFLDGTGDARQAAFFRFFAHRFDNFSLTCSGIANMPGLLYGAISGTIVWRLTKAHGRAALSKDK